LLFRGLACPPVWALRASKLAGYTKICVFK
jgi:hypothetical protein